MCADEALVEALKRAASERDGRVSLSCTEAFALAERHAVEVGEIGRLCDELHIKIVGCQLGCFP